MIKSNLNVLCRLVGNISPRKNPIIQLGVPRSGSTLVFNLLRAIFSERHIKKVHSLNGKESTYPIVATYRHPLDVMASFFQCQNLEVTDAELKTRVIELHRNGILDVLKVRDLPNVLALRYERFFDNFDYLFDKLEKFFNINVCDDLRANLKERYNVHNVKEALMPKGKDFFHWDKMTRLHGQHISRFNGKSYYYDEIFSQEQVAYLKTGFANYMAEMGYE
jgi:hypothetical protein